MIRHLLTEIGDKRTDAGLRTHLWLGRKPQHRGHGKKTEAVIHQVLQQQLFIVQALPVAEGRGEGRSSQTPRGRLDEANPFFMFIPKHRGSARRMQEREARAERHARVEQRRRDPV